MSIELLEKFIEFTGYKPVSEQYDYFDHKNCASTQFMLEYGLGTDWWNDCEKRILHLPHADPWKNEKTDNVISAHPRTFGDLHERLKELLSMQVRADHAEMKE